MKRRVRKAIDQIRPVLFTLAAEESPREACGLLGWNGSRLVLYACENAAQSPTDSFLIADEDRNDAFLAMERRGEEAWGLFHSHPHESARPSRIDEVLAEVLRAQLPLEMVWVIVGMVPPAVWVGQPGIDGELL